MVAHEKGTENNVGIFIKRSINFDYKIIDCLSVDKSIIPAVSQHLLFYLFIFLSFYCEKKIQQLLLLTAFTEWSNTNFRI